MLDAYRAGEQSQLLALAEALGWPFEIKPMRHRALGAPFNLLRGTGLCSITRTSAAALAPPWPEMVIAAGMRNEPVCRWIRRASAGHTRIVHVGRPWADPSRFDLVVTTPQYRLPERANVLQNALTLHRVTRARLAEVASAHAARLEQLPAPRVAVIVGGPSGPYHFGVHAARRLAAQAGELVRAHGGSLMITTSARTPQVVTRVLREAVDVPHELYEWRAEDAANPYFAYLGMADALVVSFDSISMLSEACATGRPVYMFDLQRDHAPGATAAPVDVSPRSLGYRALMRFGPRRLGRDIALVHQRLLREGRAAWLGSRQSAGPGAASADLDRAVARVRLLLEAQR